MDFTRAQVFIHGGGYAYGGAHDTELDGRNLAMVADVVVVTVQVGVPERSLSLLSFGTSSTSWRACYSRCTTSTTQAPC